MSYVSSAGIDILSESHVNTLIEMCIDKFDLPSAVRMLPMRAKRLLLKKFIDEINRRRGY